MRLVVGMAWVVLAALAFLGGVHVVTHGPTGDKVDELPIECVQAGVVICEGMP